MNTAKINTKARNIENDIAKLMEVAKSGDTESVNELIADIRFALSEIEKAAN